jgi:uncharacterized protein YciI
MTDAVYVALSAYQVPLSEIDPHLAEHREWAEAHYLDGRLLVSGRRTPPVGGVLVLRASSQEDAEAFVATDPFALSGFSAYQVYGFTATPPPWRSAGFAAFISSPTPS